MPAIYNLIKDYNSPDGMISMAPVWVLAVCRWTHPFLFDRSTLLTSDNFDAFEQVQDITVIVSDCTQLDIASNKGSHISSLSATLRDNTVNYLSSIFPDDWLFAWMLPNETRAKALVKRIRAGKPCNAFNDGLKFMGRVDSIFKDTSVDDGGTPSSVFSLNGCAFGEFDYTLFWEPLLAVNDSLPVWYQRLGIMLNNVITGSDKSVADPNDVNAIDINKMIPSLVRLCLGEGPFKNGNISLPGGASASMNGGIRVPGAVGKLLGKTATSKLTYSDLVDIVMGVQKYQGAAAAAQDTPAVFTPDGLASVAVQEAFKPTSNMNFGGIAQPTIAEYQSTGVPLLGAFPMVQLPFQDTPIWQILGQFLNPGVNEMYVALKSDQDGNVLPRLTVRQYPFNTNKYATYGAQNDGPPVTTYLELPRWRIHPKMLKSIKVGRSNALRSNFWMIQGTGPGTAISMEYQYVDHPPLTDKADIERSGLRRVFKTVNCRVPGGPRGVKAWQDLVADMTAGQHLALTGTITTQGVVAPVAVGDNVQFANVVYHIEQVHHSGSLQSNGKRTWRTQFQVSHGMADEETLSRNMQDTSLDAPLEEYAGVRNADPASIRVGRSALDLFEK